MLPAATTSVDGVTVPPSMPTTTSEPTAIPGHTRNPKYSRQPSAIPVGGHSGVTTAPWTVSSLSRPSRADPQ